MARSPNGCKVASGSEDDTVRVWDAGTGECVQALEGRSDDVRSVAWSPGGSKVASAGSWDKTAVRVWDAGTGENDPFFF